VNGAAADRYGSLLLERRDDGVALLTLNRPARLNSWDQAMRDELAAAFRDLVADDGLRAVVVTGAGRAFSAGEDVRGMSGLADAGTRTFRRVARGIHNVFDEIEAIEVPVIAAINGVAAGGGLELALSCDFPGSGGCSRLVKLIGLSRAKRLVMTGDMIPAREALAIGLVDEVFADDEIVARATAFAERLATKAPQAIGLAKIVLNQCANVDLDAGRYFERLGQSVLKKTEDHAEGARAFIDKRKPRFTGR
jgi:enoyl-CoA hydratase